MAEFPASDYTANPQSTSNDGPADDELAQGADYNKHDGEVDVLIQEGRKSYLKAFNNDTGGTLTKGTLVFISGFDATSGLPTVTKADASITASAVPQMAEFVVIADVLNNADGNIAKEYTVAGLDTSSFSAAGDRAYLNGTTAGGFSVTALNPANENSQDRNVRQSIGKVLIVNASTGVIHFKIEEEDLLMTARLRGLDDPDQTVAAGNDLTFNDQIIDKYGVNIVGRYHGEVSFQDNEFDDNVGGAIPNLLVTFNIGTRLVDHVAAAGTRFYSNSNGNMQFVLNSSVAQTVWVRLSIHGDGAPKSGRGVWT